MTWNFLAPRQRALRRLPPQGTIRVDIKILVVYRCRICVISIIINCLVVL
jgi:hypothetical protein